MIKLKLSFLLEPNIKNPIDRVVFYDAKPLQGKGRKNLYL